MTEQLKQVGYTVVRAMGGVIIAALIADLFNLMDFHWEDWKPIVAAAMVAGLIVIGNALNPNDTRYGINASQ